MCLIFKFKLRAIKIIYRSSYLNNGSVVWTLDNILVDEIMHLGPIIVIDDERLKILYCCYTFITIKYLDNRAGYWRENNHTSLTLSNRITLESDWLPLLSLTDHHHSHYMELNILFLTINMMVMTKIVLNK